MKYLVIKSKTKTSMYEVEADTLVEAEHKVLRGKGEKKGEDSEIECCYGADIFECAICKGKHPASAMNSIGDICIWCARKTAIGKVVD